MILIIAGSRIISGAEFVLKDYLKYTILKNKMIGLAPKSTEAEQFFSDLNLYKVYHSRFFGQVGAISTGNISAWLKKTTHYLKSKIVIKGIIEKDGITKVVGNNAGDIIYSKFIKKTIPFLLFVHEMIDKKSTLGQVIKIFNKNIYKFIAVSEAVKENLTEIGIDYKRIRVVYNGLHFEKNIKKRTGKNKISFGFVGNIEQNKDPYSFINFMKSASGNNKIETNAYMVYKHYDQEILNGVKKEITRHNLNIELLGNIERNQIDHFYKKIDFLFVPFLNNSLPTVILEAYNNGVPVIGRNSGGIPEMITHGKTGFLFNEKTEVAAIIDHICTLKNSEYELLSENANNLIKDKFNIYIKCDLTDTLLSIE